MNTLPRPHIALTVKDLDRSIAFYRALFQAEPAKVRPDYAKFALEDPPLLLALATGHPSPGGGVSHLGVEVATTGDVRRAHDRLRAEGLDALLEEGVACCYAVQDKVWATDPDGNPWEIFTRLSDTASRDSAESCGCVPGVESKS